MYRLFLKVSGSVQGVNYRWYVREKSCDLGLVGWVKNCTNGAVELLAEGSKDDLNKLKELCKQGPKYAKIENLEERWKTINHLSFDKFEIIY